MGSPKRSDRFSSDKGKVNRSDVYTDDSILLILSNLDCPRALTVWLMYRENEHQQLVNLECRSENYSDSRSFRTAYQATSFLSKADFLSLGVDPEVVAIEDFLARESENAAVNRRFNRLDLDPQFKGPNVWLLNAVTCKIRSILEPVDDKIIDEWFDACRWGPGSTSDIRGEDVTSANKFQRSVGATQRLVTLLSSLPDNSPLWDMQINQNGGYLVKEQDEITCVPKNAKTHRVIGIPVAVNSYYQLGLGEIMRRRIKRHLGIDLSNQSRNGMLAYYGARTGKVATVDFVSASNSNCYSTIREIVPSDWFQLLEACRVSQCNFDGVSEKTRKTLNLPAVHNFELFTSMGCGYTFELETLVFATAAFAVCEYLGLETNNVSVYGDDVVIPTEAFELYHSFCSWLGYTINTKKTFVSGVFRESCGEHYYGSTNVKPFYLKSRISHVSDVYVLANNIRRWSHRNLHYGCDPRLYLSWRFLQSSVPRKFRLCIPEGYGDGGFSTTFDEATPRTVKRNKWWVEGYRVRAMTFKTLGISTNHMGLHLARLHGMGPASDVVIAPDSAYNRKDGTLSNLRPRRSRPRISWIKNVSRWTDLGPWIF